MENQVKHQFKWKTEDNRFISCDDMETSHLFYVLRMIWNSRMPPEARVEGRVRTMGAFYTDEFLKEAILNMTIELAERIKAGKGLEPNLQMQFEYMVNYLCKNPIIVQKKIDTSN